MSLWRSDATAFSTSDSTNDTARFTASDATSNVAIVNANYASQKKLKVGSTVTVAKNSFKVIGIASEPNHDWLRSHGVTPVSYGDDLKERIVALAPDGVDAFIDLFGPQYVQLAVELGVPRDRIETIIAFDAAKEYGTKSAGSGDASTTEVLAEMAGLVASGQIEVPIAATYPLDKVKDAYDELEQRHTRGKIVLIP